MDGKFGSIIEDRNYDSFKSELSPAAIYKK